MGKTSHTCGACQAAFVLDLTASENLGKSSASPGNTQCVTKSLTCENGLKDNDEADVDCGGSCSPCRVSQACLVDSDCYFEVCSADLGVCMAPQKQCVNGCNGRGSCSAKDYNGKAMELTKCTEDVKCSVTCSCNDGYRGEGCERDEQAHKEVVKQRKSMLNVLLNVTKLQDLSSENVNQQASSIKSLVSRVDELDETSKALAANLVQDISAGGEERRGAKQRA